VRCVRERSCDRSAGSPRKERQAAVPSCGDEVPQTMRAFYPTPTTGATISLQSQPDFFFRTFFFLTVGNVARSHGCKGPKSLPTPSIDTASRVSSMVVKIKEHDSRRMRSRGPSPSVAPYLRHWGRDKIVLRKTRVMHRQVSRGVPRGRVREILRREPTSLASYSIKSLRWVRVSRCRR
jgi:hypothetical protein